MVRLLIWSSGTQSFGVVFWQGLFVQLIVADYVDRFAFGQELPLFALMGRFSPDAISKLDARNRAVMPGVSR